MDWVIVIICIEYSMGVKWVNFCRSTGMEGILGLWKTGIEKKFLFYCDDSYSLSII